MTTKVKIQKIRGDTSRISCQVRDSRRQIVNISSWTGFTLTVDPKEDPVSSFTKVSQTTGQFTTNGIDGRFYFNADPNIPAGIYFYDVQALDSNGDKTTIMRGQYIVLQDITKT